MQYFRNHELAKRYNVSQTTVGKWVEAAKNGKLDLSMIEDSGKSFIAATNKNSKVIEELLEDRKKYVNKLSHKIVTPKPEFYARFSPEQVLDIVKSLSVNKELPWSYNYHGQGAAYWDRQVKIRLSEYGSLPESALMKMTKSYIDSITNGYKINVIDVGPGNAEPVREFIADLIKEGRMGRYIAIDSSPEMLVLAEKNLKKWFGVGFNFEGDIRDVTYERFSEVIAKDKNDKSVNLLLFLGGTLCNFQSMNDALRVLYGSMGPDDYLIHSQKLDTIRNRSIFSFERSRGEKKLASNYRTVVDLLNIDDDSLFNVVMGFDEKLQRRYLGVELRVSLTIDFKIEACNLTQSVDFKKGDVIMLWYYKHQSAEEVIDQFSDNGFDVIHSSQTQDREFMIVVTSLKHAR
ncbi:MAG TPA: L-histidine N(alpha)-methyltransferase [Candidatus Saccharimonadales bacterium]|nr:L-histidine N(alpha)-methyltransferase [Candidatus Saccharimonadales bacterium]